MSSIEEMIAKMESPEQFRADCIAAFSDAAGRRLLVALCNMAHPLEHGPIENPSLAAHRRGRSEIVAALWSRSERKPTATDIPPKPPTP